MKPLPENQNCGQGDRSQKIQNIFSVPQLAVIKNTGQKKNQKPQKKGRGLFFKIGKIRARGGQVRAVNRGQADNAQNKSGQKHEPIKLADERIFEIHRIANLKLQIANFIPEMRSLLVKNLKFEF
jgi:hypothetical protein